MGKIERLKQLAELIRQHRWTALATVDGKGVPQASMVGFAHEKDFSCFYFHLSRLASHTGYLMERGVCSLVISEMDDGHSDPQQLARVSIQGTVEAVAKELPDHQIGRECYLKCLPDAEPLFSFPDFILFRFTPTELRFVGGFGQAFSYSAGELVEASTL